MLLMCYAGMKVHPTGGDSTPSGPHAPTIYTEATYLGTYIEPRLVRKYIYKTYEKGLYEYIAAS